MTESAAEPYASAAAQRSAWRDLLRQEDWWANWIGLGLILLACGLAGTDASLGWLAVAPQKWHALAAAGEQLRAQAPRYGALLLFWGVLLGGAAAALGIRPVRFLPAFLVLFVASALIYLLGFWDQAAHYNLEPPLVALALGLLLANTLGVPGWLQPALRVEFYIKTGIVLLGAGLPLALLAWAGPVAMLQAAIVSLATFAVIYFTAVRLGLERRFAATLGTGGAVCGVSGAIAVGGAVGARRQHVSIAISLVVIYAIVMIFVLPLAARALGLSTGVAGAWIGTSEFADAAGLAAAQAYGAYAGAVPGIGGAPDTAVAAFTLMKVVGRDVWIGVWAFVLSLLATARWEDTGVQGRAGIGEIWRRFPKFVLGFFAASLIVTLAARGHSYVEYKHEVVPRLVAPLQVLRTWAFTFAFLAIGLSTRLRELAAVGARPFYAFTAGVIANTILGFVLSTQVFVGFWEHLGP